MLHGEIKINDVVVGTWEARNLYTVWNEEMRYRVTTYECDIRFTDEAGYPYEARGYMVRQRQEAGAVLLAAKVMEHGYRRARRKVVQ